MPELEAQKLEEEEEIKNESNAGPDMDDDEDAPSGKRERRKIEIRFIQDKSRRHITFSKRKAGIMKKAYELSVLTGTQVLLLVVSETGLVYTFTTPKLQPLVTKPEGKNLIQACLNAPEEGAEEAEEEPAPQPAQTQQPTPQPVVTQPQVPVSAPQAQAPHPQAHYPPQGMPMNYMPNQAYGNYPPFDQMNQQYQ
ncbi:transcription factor [Saccharomycopsis crataegensis]|uniref:Transcription factor n=1 Tax=Saccharomycopsis crataegensis TaxID=43959 RepID=A0AAV5QU61_9ASCO|nr:transcription factor [Saccharomycopsis crataegensis]